MKKNNALQKAAAIVQGHQYPASYQQSEAAPRNYFPAQCLHARERSTGMSHL